MVSSVQEEYIRSFSLTKRFFDDLDAAANRNRQMSFHNMHSLI